MSLLYRKSSVWGKSQPNPNHRVVASQKFTALSMPVIRLLHGTHWLCLYCKSLSDPSNRYTSLIIIQLCLICHRRPDYLGKGELNQHDDVNSVSEDDDNGVIYEYICILACFVDLLNTHVQCDHWFRSIWPFSYLLNTIQLLFHVILCFAYPNGFFPTEESGFACSE